VGYKKFGTGVSYSDKTLNTAFH